MPRGPIRKILKRAASSLGNHKEQALNHRLNRIREVKKEPMTTEGKFEVARLSALSEMPHAESRASIIAEEPLIRRRLANARRTGIVGALNKYSTPPRIRRVVKRMRS